MKFDFAKNQIVDNLDRVPSDFHGLYAETTDGKFKLNTEHETVGPAIKAITGLATALNAARGESKAVKDKLIDLSPLMEFGENPETILATFNQKLEEVGKKSGGKVGQEDIDKAVAAAKEALGKAHKAELDKHATLATGLRNQLYSVLVTGEARSALAEAGAIKPELVLPFIKERVRVAEENGQFSVNVMDEHGEVRYGGTGSPMSVKELVLEMKGAEDYGPLFKSEAASGGGTPPQRNRAANRSGQKREDMTPNEKIAEGLRKLQFQSGESRR